MNLTCREHKITKDELFARINQLSAYQWYCPGIKLGKKMCSPLRADKHEGSWSIKEIDKDVVWRDWATDQGGNVIKFVMEMYNIDHRTAIDKIAVDMGIVSADGKINSTRIVVPSNSEGVADQKKSTVIQCTTKAFTKLDKEYWNSYHISTAELKEFQVFSIKELYINRIKQQIGKDELVYGYLFDDHLWKIYRPYSKTDKWRNNLPITMMHGLDRVKDTDIAVVTKSLKDEICMKKFIPAICSVQNESKCSISKDNIKYLQKNSKRVYVNFDNDTTGIQACKHYNSYGFKWLNVPKNIPIVGTDKYIKDISDWMMYRGPEVVEQYLIKKGII